MGLNLSPFAEPLGTAAAVFPVLAAAVLVPLTLYHYRRHGLLHPWRALMDYSFLFYLLAATFVVLLPLPQRPSSAETSAWLAAHQNLSPQWDPTAAFREMAGPSGRLRVGAVLQVAFNTILLTPLGFFLAYTRGRGFWGALGAGLAVSLGFEVAQVTGLFWYYPGPYRLFDTADLLLNTLGSGLGALLAQGALRLGLPPLSSLQGPTTPWIGAFRRTLALAFDLLAAGTTALILAVALPFPGWSATWVALSLVLWLIALPALDGRGLGKGLTLCGVRLKGGRTARTRVLGRQLALWGIPSLALILSSEPWRLNGLWLSLVGLTGLIALGVHGFQVVFDPEHASWVDRRLGTRVRNLWKAPPRPSGTRRPHRPGRPRS